MKILITGVNGFIGSWLTRELLKDDAIHILGIDIQQHNLETPHDSVFGRKNFTFLALDLMDPLSKPQVEECVKDCDVILPLAAVANPYLYIKNPLHVFDLAFLHNLDMIKWASHHRKRLIFPSSSEVYGMSSEAEFNEETTKLTLGPVDKMRWIYSSSKQLLDRVICAHGLHEGLSYTIFRPFNWMGPRLDNITSEKEGESRALTQFISNALNGRPLHLVNGGSQRRCFIYIEDALKALMKIIENKENCAHNKIFNIGNPRNNTSILDLAKLIIRKIEEREDLRGKITPSKIQLTSSDTYFGQSYEDVSQRVPSIEKARTYLKWAPTTSLEEALEKTLEYYLSHPNSLLRKNEKGAA